VEKSTPGDLLTLVARSEPIAAKLRQIENRIRPIVFSHVIDSAQAFLVATIAHNIDKTIWVFCPSVHSQELLYESLLNWQPDALFLPEAEFAAVENILPDPEIAAERLALLSLVERNAGAHVIVATHASLDQAAPEPGALISASIQLRRRTTEKMERILEQLSGAGYERVAQVTTRGQFAVRGGIVDLYSWQAPLPVRVEFFGDEIESLREFDIDTQTSVNDLGSVEILLSAAVKQGAAVSKTPGRFGNRPSLIEDQSGFIRDYIDNHDLKIDIEPGENSDAKFRRTDSD